MEHVTRLASRAVAALLCALACMFGLMLGTASAEPTEYPLWVQGVQVTSDNAADVLGDGTVSFVLDEKAGTATLTLDGADIDVPSLGSSSDLPPYMTDAAGIMVYGEMTIVLKGENTISNKAALTANRAAGINTMSTVHITGEGSLTINLEVGNTVGEYGSGTYLYGINSINGIISPGATPRPVTIEDGATVSLSLKGAGTDPITGCYGIVAYSGLIVDDATLAIETGDASYSSGGVGGFGDFTFSGNSTVDMAIGAATGTTDDDDGSLNIGIQTMSGTVTISDMATVTAVLADSVGESLGVFAGNLVVQDSGTLRAFAGEAPASYGVFIMSGSSPGGTPIIIDPDDSPLVGSITVSDIAILEAAGHTRALSMDPIIDDHMFSGAFVSWYYEHDDATTWKESLGPIGGDESDFQYVRIPGPGTITRLAGDEANQTAAAIAAEAFAPDSCEWVVLARQDDFADALGATGLAGVLNCPIVLTDREALSPAAAEAITRLGATKCYIIGGEGAMKPQLETDLKAQTGLTTIERLWGENSYDTSLACAEKIVELGGTDESAIVAMSTNFQDALSISPIAYKFGLPLILQTWGDTSADRGFTDEAKAFLADKSLTVVGGTGAISDESIDGYGLYVRLWGETGYDTSNEIAKWAIGKGYLSSFYTVIACGAQAPKGVDALAGAALAGKAEAPILLVNGNEEMEAADLTTIDGFLVGEDNLVRNVYVLGGTYVVPPALFDYIAEVTCTIERSE